MMRRFYKISVLVILSLILFAFGFFILRTKIKRPAIETKFVQDNHEAIEEKQAFETEVTLVEPGDYVLLGSLRHIYQTFNNCGPATLSMILSYYGIDVSQDELGDKMRPYQNPKGDNDDKTIFTYEFVDWAKFYGLEAVARVNGDINLLKKFTANGIPVVVKTWLNPGEDIGHFRIIKGFDEKQKVIIQDDSYQGTNKKISYYDLLSMWQPFNYDYIIVYTKEMENKVAAIIGGEMNETVAWRNVLKRAEREREIDPENSYPVFNIVTAAYHLDDYERATKEFEQVADKLPRRMLWYQIEPILSYQKLGNYERVFQIIEHILNNGNRAFSELYLIRGEIYLVQGNKAKAQEQFELALTYNQNLKKAKELLKEQG